MEFKKRTLLFLFGFFCGCAHIAKLTPAPGVETLNQPYTAKVSHAEIEMKVETDAWQDFPRNLNKELIPVRIRLENHSTHPLRIQYGLFSLEYADQHFAALPLFSIQRTITVKNPNYLPRFIGSEFYVARYAAPYYDRAYPVVDFPYDAYYYDRYYPYWEVQLPTKDMIEHAIPEGVLYPKGFVQGFLYFQKPPKRSRNLNLKLNLLDQTSAEKFGEISIPYYYQ